VRAVVLGAAVMAVLAGCGTQSRVVSLKPLTPSETRSLVKSFKPGCNTPGRVLIRYVSPVVHGKGSESWWCVEPAQSYRVVSRDLRCPARTRLKIDLKRHMAACEHSPKLGSNRPTTH
jgi:hypothetical protein